MPHQSESASEKAANTLDRGDHSAPASGEDLTKAVFGDREHG